MLQKEAILNAPFENLYQIKALGHRTVQSLFLNMFLFWSNPNGFSTWS